MAKRIQKKERMIKRLFAVLIFLVVFNLLAIPLYLVMYFDISWKSLQIFNAQLLVVTLDVFRFDSNVEDFTVNVMTQSGLQKIEISWDSTGWKSMYAVAVLIIATPVSRLSKRIKFALMGVLAIFILNYLRVVTTILVSLYSDFRLFDIVHTFLWREGLILGVVGFWFIWLLKEKHNIR